MKPGHSRHLRRKLLHFGLSILVLLAFALIWNSGQFREGLDIERIIFALRQAGQDYGLPVAIAGFALASILAVPLLFLTILSIVAFGPILGSITTLVGGGIGSAVSFSLGRRLGQEVVHHLAGSRVNVISERLGRRGILAAAALRMIPLAPFAIVNMIAGTSHIRLRDFLIGSAIGMTPGTIVFALFVDKLDSALRNPGASSLVLVGLTLLLIIVGVWIAKKWIARLE